MPDPPFKIEKIEIGIGRRCPHCGELPEDFRSSFERLVQEEWIVPAKSRHLSLDSKGKPFEYKPTDPCKAGLYSAVIVPRQLVGKVIQIKVKGE